MRLFSAGTLFSPATSFYQTASFHLPGSSSPSSPHTQSTSAFPLILKGLSYKELNHWQFSLDASPLVCYQEASILIKTVPSLGGHWAFLCFNLQIDNRNWDTAVSFYGQIKFITIITEILHFENHPFWVLCFPEHHHHFVCVRESRCNSQDFPRSLQIRCISLLEEFIIISASAQLIFHLLRTTLIFI